MNFVSLVTSCIVLQEEEPQKPISCPLHGRLIAARVLTGQTPTQSINQVLEEVPQSFPHIFYMGLTQPLACSWDVMLYPINYIAACVLTRLETPPSQSLIAQYGEKWPNINKTGTKDMQTTSVCVCIVHTH